MEKTKKHSGTSPGTLVYVGKERKYSPTVRIMTYNNAEVIEKILKDPSEISPLRSNEKITWVHVCGVHHTDLIEKVGKEFGINLLILEDIVSTRQRPKIEDYGDTIYFVMRTADSGSGKWKDGQQISVILGKNFVLSFQETQENLFHAVEDRIRNMKGRIPSMGTDYLTYRILDSVLDGFINELDEVQTRIDHLEEQLIGDGSHFSDKIIYGVRQELIYLRKALFPLREFSATFRNIENDLLTKGIDFFIMDFSDHATRVIETVESFRENVKDLLELNLAHTNNRTNETMKVLTIISAIFIPLSFIVGYYGMNLKLPEYQWDGAFYLSIGLMIGVAGLQLYIFKKKKWL